MPLDSRQQIDSVIESVKSYMGNLLGNLSSPTVKVVSRVANECAKYTDVHPDGIAICLLFCCGKVSDQCIFTEMRTTAGQEAVADRKKYDDKGFLAAIFWHS